MTVVHCPLKYGFDFEYSAIVHLYALITLVDARIDKKTKFQCDQIDDIARVSDTIINYRLGPDNGAASSTFKTVSI